jgi:uncharacterized protein YgbK (DUF1537 family)
MIRIGIVADDLTGAADAAVQFVRAGWKTELQIRPSHSSAAVIAVSTDSRALNAREAAALVTTAVTRHREAGITHVYKKVDSTLRGQVRAEIQAACASWSPRAIAVVCPAFPAADRAVVNGQLQVGGQPVAETAVGADRITPVSESHIPTLLGASHVKHDFTHSIDQLAEKIRRNGPIVVVDAASDSDLRLLAQAIDLVGPDAIAVGSAGLARELAVVWASRLTPRPLPLTASTARLAPHPFFLSPSAAPVLVIVTSLHEVARRQAAAVVAAGARHHQPALEDLIDDRAWARWSENVVCALIDMNIALVLTSPLDRGNDDLATLIPLRFADLVARVVNSGHVSGVVVTGGDGARALVDALDATGITLLAEVTDGVPLGTLVGGFADGLPVVTKAGAFGDDRTLLRAVEAVRRLRD